MVPRAALRSQGHGCTHSPMQRLRLRESLSETALNTVEGAAPGLGSTRGQNHLGRPSASRDSLTPGKPKSTQGQHLPKASSRLASALAQPGSMWRGGEGRGGMDDRWAQPWGRPRDLARGWPGTPGSTQSPGQLSGHVQGGEFAGSLAEPPGPSWGQRSDWFRIWIRAAVQSGKVQSLEQANRVELNWCELWSSR